MSWNAINLNAIAPMPWKNGGGTTRELVAWPKADDWLWRMSVAEVTQSGPFSRFEGIERWFAVLVGAGVTLKIAGQKHTLTPASQPFCFDGALATDCELMEGVTQDFNLMTRKDRIEATMTRIESPFSCIIDNLNTVAIFAMNTVSSVQFNSTTDEIKPGTLTWRSTVKGDQIQLDTKSALLISIVHKVTA